MVGGVGTGGACAGRRHLRQQACDVGAGQPTVRQRQLAHGEWRPATRSMWRRGAMQRAATVLGCLVVPSAGALRDFSAVPCFLVQIAPVAHVGCGLADGRGPLGRLPEQGPSRRETGNRGRV